MLYICSKCKIDMDESNFYPSERKNNGICKKCWILMPSQSNIGQKLYREANPDKVKQWSENSYIKNRITWLLYDAKKRAEIKGLEFSLTREDIMIPDICPILNIPIIIDAGKGRTGNGPSIDRLDNKKGYTKNNILIVSDRANTLKSDSTQKERESIYAYYKKLYEERGL